MGRKERAFLAGKDSFRGRLLGIFSASYYQRERLIAKGEVIYGYAFRDYEEGDNRDFTYPTWVLFSPASAIDDDPAPLAEAAERLLAYCAADNGRKDKLCRAVKDDWAEPQYVELPKELTQGRLVYLSMVNVRTKANPSFRLGLNLLLANRKASKEVIYLPERYWTDAFLSHYLGKEKDDG